MHRGFSDALASAALTVVIVYLAAHALSGRQGIISYVRLQEQERGLLAARARLNAAIAEEEGKAARLSAEKLDLDYLEELAFKMLAAAPPEALTLAAPVPAGGNAFQP